MKLHKQRNTKKTIIITIALLAAGVIVAMAAYSLTRPQVQPPEYAPPTKEEAAAGETQKEKNIAKDKAVSDAEKVAEGLGATLKNAEVIVTDASYYQYDGNAVELRAYIANVYENGGTCTATLTLNGQTVTVNGAPFKDVSTTQCGAMDIPRSKFPAAGDWQVIVSYTSPTASGHSPPKIISVK